MIIKSSIKRLKDISCNTNLHVSYRLKLLVAFCIFLKFIHQMFNVDTDFPKILVHVIPINIVVLG